MNKMCKTKFTFRTSVMMCLYTDWLYKCYLEKKIAARRSKSMCWPTRTHAHAHKHARARTHTDIGARMYRYTHTYINAHTYVHIHAYTHTHARARAHSHTHTHKHTEHTNTDHNQPHTHTHFMCHSVFSITSSTLSLIQYTIRNSQRISWNLETESLFVQTHETTTYPYPQPNESNPYYPLHILSVILIISLLLRL